jgi:DNA-binding transcriptional regulator LsrR (DeoR family)
MGKENLEENVDLAELARSYYINNRSQGDIAKQYGVKQSTVSNWLQRAKERGVIFFDIDSEFAISGSEHRDKSTQLRDTFSLKEAFVVDVGRATSYDRRRADELHTAIANTVGSVRFRNWIQAGEHVVIGGGRAPIKVARMIMRMSPSQRDVRISPLSGRMWNGAWQEDGHENLQRPLDSDDAARLLGLAYEREPGTRFSQIGLPLYQDEDSVKRVIAEECVFKSGGGWNTEWGLQPPDRALVGVGVLHLESGHRIPELVSRIQKDPTYKVAKQLQLAAKSFKEAMDFALSKGLPHFGDVANRVFPSLFLPAELEQSKMSLKVINKAYDELCVQLGQINSRAVVMGWDHLREIPSVWAVAGGDLKINALWTLLIARRCERSRKKSIIKELATDVESSNLLLQALQDYNKLSQDHRDWYDKMVDKIFI